MVSTIITITIFKNFLDTIAIVATQTTPLDRSPLLRETWEDGKHEDLIPKGKHVIKPTCLLEFRNFAMEKDVPSKSQYDFYYRHRLVLRAIDKPSGWLKR